jgi:WD40 repeat protein/serine/threonine protein kinase
MATDVKQAKAIFLDVIHNIPVDRWTAYVQEAAGGDATVAAQVQRLLQAHLSDRALATEAVGSVAAKVALPSAEQIVQQIGSQIGPYKLLEQIGEGGMGLVYMAEQQRPLRRLVALKIIKPGMDSKQVIARFEAERQALAMMDHPNIAKIYDAGTTGEKDEGQRTKDEPESNSSFVLRTSSLAAGRPYFAMELVRGIPINEFATQQELTVRQRLELFIQVCQAIQHAHQKGIIHRDLKPTNVLVSKADTVPLPKVIDFGIAKALGDTLARSASEGNTLYTGFGQLIGTPLYMSPEQAEMNQFGVDTRSDVYSLGVLLYELLTGTTPFDKETLHKAGFEEMRRIIREVEPETVSNRIARTRRVGSAHHSADLSPLSLALRPFAELDWIVAKSLEKDRERRYESASAVAADIQRYLDDKPVLACPPTAMYRFQKFARKHKPALFTAAAIAACLILGTTVSAWQAVRATTAEAQAEANEKKAVANEQKASTERDEAQRQRDEVNALNEKLGRTLYAAHMNLAKTAWDEAAVARVEELLDEHLPKQNEPDFRGFEWHYLNRLAHSELLHITGHSAAINCVAYSSDGSRLASASSDGTVRIWDAETGKLSMTLQSEGERNRFNFSWVGFGAAGSRLAAVGQQLKVWDASTGKELLSVDGLFDTGAFSPDGKLLAVGSWRGDAPGNREPELKVWDAESGKELFTRDARSGHITSLIFSPDSIRLATASNQGRVVVWNVRTGLEILAINEIAYGVAISSDGKRLATAGGELKLWNAATGQQLRRFDDSAGMGVSFSPDGHRIAVGSSRGTIKVWDADTGAILHGFKGTGTCVAFSPDGKRLATNAPDKSVKVWNAKKDQERAIYQVEDGNSVAFSRDWRYMGSACLDNSVKVKDLRTGEDIVVLRGHTVPVHRIRFSNDGKLIATGGGGKRTASGGYSVGPTDKAELRVWNLQTGKELFSVPDLLGNVQSMSFSPDGTRIAMGSGPPGPSRPGQVSGVIRIFDTRTGDEVRTIKGHSGFVQCVVYHPDGNRLASAGGQETKIWDTESGKELLSSPGGGQLAFSWDGNQLASAGGGRARVLDVSTGQLIRSLYKGQGGIMGNVAFSPDGRRLAAASDVKTVKIWDVAEGHETLTIKGHELNVGYLSFSADGHRLAAASYDGVVKIYDATPLPEKP